MTKGSAQHLTFEEAVSSLLELWQLPIAIGSHWLSLALESAAAMVPHAHVAHHEAHEELVVPPEIESASEQCLFA